MGHVTYFWNFGNPSISQERLELKTSNLACTLPGALMKEMHNYIKGGQEGVTWPTFEILGPLDISGTVGARRAKNIHPLFLWLIGHMLSDFNNIWLYYSWENLQPNNVSFLIISSLHMNITEFKKRIILYTFNAAASSCCCTSYLQLFEKSVHSPQSPTFMYWEIP